MARRHTLDDQRPTAELQENSSKIAQAPKALKADHPDWDHMVAAVDGAQKRAEDLERENLEVCDIQCQAFTWSFIGRLGSGILAIRERWRLLSQRHREYMLTECLASRQAGRTIEDQGSGQRT